MKILNINMKKDYFHIYFASNKKINEEHFF